MKRLDHPFIGEHGRKRLGAGMYILHQRGRDRQDRGLSRLNFRPAGSLVQGLRTMP